MRWQSPIFRRAVGKEMAPHQVTTTDIPAMEVGATPIVIKVREDDVRLGDLKVSQGRLFWLPSGHVVGHELEWSRFAELAEEHGKKRRT